MTNLRTAWPLIFVFLAAACTGGSGDLPGSTSSGGSSGSTSGASGGSSSGGGAQIRASDFDQSCTGDQDCVAVFEGDVCAPCACANAAIALTARAEYNDARSNLFSSADCVKPDVECDVCPDPPVSCGQGTCAITR
jgi:hypothetical protein